MITDKADAGVFIPLIPVKRKRFGRMVFNAMPGIILVLSVTGSRNETVGAFLLNIFCVISGSLVALFAFREFRNPGKGIWLGADMISVFTGLLLIAQGTVAFDAHKGFQPAHLLFVAALLFVFKGVMLPESLVRKGFTITESGIAYRDSAFSKSTLLPVDKLEDIIPGDKMLSFKYAGDETKTISLDGTENIGEIAVTLKHHFLNN